MMRARSPFAGAASLALRGRDPNEDPSSVLVFTAHAFRHASEVSRRIPTKGQAGVQTQGWAAAAARPAMPCPGQSTMRNSPHLRPREVVVTDSF
ncbi:hypothetical protein MRX96_043769 [Rhipicephalus microplus]